MSWLLCAILLGDQWIQGSALTAQKGTDTTVLSYGQEKLKGEMQVAKNDQKRHVAVAVSGDGDGDLDGDVLSDGEPTLGGCYRDPKHKAPSLRRAHSWKQKNGKDVAVAVSGDGDGDGDGDVLSDGDGDGDGDDEPGAPRYVDLGKKQILGKDEAGKVWKATIKTVQTKEKPMQERLHQKLNGDGKKMAFHQKLEGAASAASGQKQSKALKQSKVQKKDHHWAVQASGDGDGADDVEDSPVATTTEIIVDFSTHGGPANVVGEMTKDTIEWKDGNIWIKAPKAICQDLLKAENVPDITEKATTTKAPKEKKKKPVESKAPPEAGQESKGGACDMTLAPTVALALLLGALLK